MSVPSLALLLVLSQAPAAEEARPPVTPAPSALPAPPAAPPAGSPTSSAARPIGSAPDASLPRAAIEKLGQGDRAFLDRDYRNALFAYMDAAYLAPASASPRVKLARAYLALRYPERAIEQAEKALSIDPANGEARKLLDEARSGGPQPAAVRPPAPPATPPAGAPPAARVFPYTPEPAAASAPPARAAAVAAPAPTVATATPARGAGAGPAPAAATAPQGASAAQQYRQGIEHLRNREFEKAVTALSEAVTLDPGLAVAYSARASARFALGAYREAADDYRAALERDPKLATPLYGLAECHRVLGESKEAAARYRQYAESRAPDVRDDLRAVAARRAQELH